jgi:glycosyltransferase involved in cell wall biosynthesis
MRVAIFAETFLPKWDGVAHTLCHLLDHLALRGHHSLMFAPGGVLTHYADTPIVSLPSFDCLVYPGLRLVPPLVNVERELTEFWPDVVHLVNPVSLGLVGLRAARYLGLPVVMSYHTDLPGYTERYGVGLLRDLTWACFRWLHNQADLNLCPSPKCVRDAERMRRMGRAARAFAETQRWDVVLDGVLEEYANVVAAQRAARQQPRPSRTLSRRAQA